LAETEKQGCFTLYFTGADNSATLKDMVDIADPVTVAPVQEIGLRDAPLVRVIAQVRFPLVVAIEQRDFIAPFQEAIRADYPLLREEQTPQGFVIGPGGVSSVPPQRVWRFADVEERWRVTLAPDFLALETTAYTSRTDFFAKLQSLLHVLNERVEPKIVDRLGVRYIDRISGTAMARIADLVRPEVRGIAGTTASDHVQHALTEAVFLINRSRILARWGRLPAGATVDSNAIEAIDEPSWILDLDMFSTESFTFDVDRIVAEAKGFAERIYAFFRWAVTDEFLRYYGGRA
jgi:uncharacterized protein (TIGR04255 family)